MSVKEHALSNRVDVVTVVWLLRALIGVGVAWVTVRAFLRAGWKQVGSANLFSTSISPCSHVSVSMVFSGVYISKPRVSRVARAAASRSSGEKSWGWVTLADGVLLEEFGLRSLVPLRQVDVLW